MNTERGQGSPATSQQSAGSKKSLYQAFLDALQSIPDLSIRQMSFGLAIGLNIAGTLTVLGLVLLTNYDAAARGLFSKPFAGVHEVTEFAVVLIVFLQLPDVVRVDRLTRSDGLLTVLGPKYPRLADRLRRAINLASAVFLTLVIMAVWPDFVGKWNDGSFFGTRGVFTIPWWPLKLIVLISASLCVVLFAIKVLSRRIEPKLIPMPEHDEAQDQEAQQ